MSALISPFNLFWLCFFLSRSSQEIERKRKLFKCVVYWNLMEKVLWVKCTKQQLNNLFEQISPFFTALVCSSISMYQTLQVASFFQRDFVKSAFLTHQNYLHQLIWADVHFFGAFFCILMTNWCILGFI